MVVNRQRDVVETGMGNSVIIVRVAENIFKGRNTRNTVHLTKYGVLIHLEMENC